MNEQEIQKKIEKREKTDIVLAYILIIILLGAILIVLYLKYFKEDNDIDQSEHTSNYITLETISAGLNSSSLVQTISLNSTFTENSINVNYNENEEVKELMIPLINNELEIIFPEEDNANVESIYKEITKTICVYYGNDENSCTSAIETIDNNTTNGIRFENNGNNNVIYINMMTSIDVANGELTNNTLSLEDISKENTTSIQIENVMVTNLENTVSVEYNINNTSSNPFNLTISLYDENDTLLEEKTKEYQDIDAIPTSDILEFTLSDTLKLEMIKKYSITITE